MTAQHRSTPQGRAAFSQLCEKYWYPLYAYIRRKESDTHRAADLTQSFFAKVMEKNYLADADPRRGRFRTFLLASLNHFLANEWDRSQTQKRGGGKRHFSLDVAAGEERWRAEADGDCTPDVLYERQWAIELLRHVLEQLEQEFASQGQKERFEILKPFLMPGELGSYADMGQRLGMNENAVRVAVHRLRTRYRELLRANIAETVENPTEIDDEIRKLFETFAS